MAMAQSLSFANPNRKHAHDQRHRSSGISVDSILGYASDVPSMRERLPTHAERPPPLRTPSGRRPVAPRLAGRPVPVPQAPTRTSKVTEKLVLLPEATSAEDDDDDTRAEYAADNNDKPERDDEQALRAGGIRGKSYAERLPKARRAGLARVTAYCWAQSLKLAATANFLREQLGARTKLYDDCLYTVFQLPLLPGTNGHRIHGGPVIKQPGGTVALEETERRDYGETEEDEQYVVRNEEDRLARPTSPQRQPSDEPMLHDSVPLTFAELFVFSYGICVFWGFSASQERDLLADLSFQTAAPLALFPAATADVESEEFHVCYAPNVSRPRVFNDMITLRDPNDRMLKLAISHALAQSTKLCAFEEQAARRMAEAAHAPRTLALTGQLGLSRAAVVKLLGAMYATRMDVNISSSVLDTPDFLWNAEPTLHPPYSAVRQYLEIDGRVQSLNARSRVFLDLAEMLSDSLSDAGISRRTWIIIFLIGVSIVVTASEVFLRFGLLRTHAVNAVFGKQLLHNVLKESAVY